MGFLVSGFKFCLAVFLLSLLSLFMLVVITVVVSWFGFGVLHTSPLSFIGTVVLVLLGASSQSVVFFYLMIQLNRIRF